MKVVLINPPSPYLKDARAQPPMGLLYLAASLEVQGEPIHRSHNVSVVDLAGDDEWQRTCSKLRGDVFGVSCTTPNFSIVKEIFKLLPGKALKIVGGPHPTFMSLECLVEFDCDIVVMGEGEKILPQILADYEDTGSHVAVYDGGLVDLDKLPMPARHLVDLKSYNPEMEGKATTIFTSRGCPYNCAFCAKLTGNVVRYRAVDKVMAELQTLVNEYGYRNVVFEDDNFCLDHDRVKAICKEIIDRKLDINIRICPRADSVNPSLLKLLRKANVTEISFGVESGSQKMLNFMQKGTTVDVIKRAIRAAKDVGMLVKIYLIVGFPGETEQTLEETKQFVKDTQPDKWLLQNFVPYPGTDVWNNPKKYGVTWISHDYSQFYTVGKGGVGGLVFKTKTLTQEKIRMLHDDLFAFLADYKPMGRS
ncbi:MAG: B12-binding domain-containing radical SAM protein [Candidatus Pacebacteria bacterium]|nr:B12-binding domain-containing radical SAM protein [Candidatus Paceibacterota bacterium]